MKMKLGHDSKRTKLTAGALLIAFSMGYFYFNKDIVVSVASLIAGIVFLAESVKHHD